MQSKIGKKLFVCHATDGMGEYRKCKQIERTIKYEYMDGRVVDDCGDVWDIKPFTSNSFQTVMTLNQDYESFDTKRR